MVGFNVQPIWPKIIQNYIGKRGYRDALGRWQRQRQWYRHGHPGRRRNEVVGSHHRGAADYMAMLVLSVAQSPDHCDPLPSILDLMSSSCARVKRLRDNSGDLAF